MATVWKKEQHNVTFIWYTATSYFVSATGVVLDLFVIGTKTQRNNKYMLSGKIVQYLPGILLYVFQWDRHLPFLSSTNIFVGKDSYTALSFYKYFHLEGQLYSLEFL
jgi:hypothetical protein